MTNAFAIATTRGRPAGVPAILAAIALLLPAFACWGSDLAKERRWANQIVDQLFDGEPVWLRAEGVEFLGLHTEAVGSRNGAVILLHGIGVHPDWPQVINPLRVGLSERGWDTLSLQMPVLPNDAPQEEYRPLFPQVPPRIDAGLGFLEDKGAEPVFVIGHSLGASMATHYLGSGSGSGVSGFVAIGAGIGGGEGIPEELTVALSNIQVPILDLYGEFDLEQVLTGAPRRAAAARASGNEHFTQIETPGADHFFDGYEEELLDTVARWLEARR